MTIILGATSFFKLRYIKKTIYHIYSTGARAEKASRGGGNETEGVHGLKSLGVRDLHHKTAFLACNVLSGTMRIGDEAADSNEEASPATIKVIYIF